MAHPARRERSTDRHIAEETRTRPLAVSFERLGATAAMWVLIEAQLLSLGVSVDRAGVEGRVCETYPAAALSAWGLGKRKRSWPELQQAFPFLSAEEALVPRFASDDVCDAVVCALVARARELGLTDPPPEWQLDVARREGWIHVSRSRSDALPAPRT